MYLPEWLKRLPMKSLYYSVLLAMVTTLSVSFLVFHEISDRMTRKAFDPIFDRFDQLEIESARTALASGGKDALKQYLNRLDRSFWGSSHFLLDADGVDVFSGENKSRLLPPPSPAPPLTRWRTQEDGHFVRAYRSQDGENWIVATGVQGRPDIWTYLPYYFLVLGATILLCWLASVGVVSPIRRIAASIALFGHGNLSVRVRTNRLDEIGQLGRSFNQMAERLERLIVSERRLLGDISHELRSPLARLKFAVKLARTSPDSKTALDRIERDVDRISSLVAGILEITYIESESAVQAAEMVRMEDLVDEVVHDCALEADVRDCRIAVNGRLDGHVQGNRELLRRATENVLRNGIRYSPEHSTIDVSIAEDFHLAVISIRDYGPGVPEEALTKIFDPFFRVDESRDATSGGSGLGLSIAKQALQVHRGTIVAENASPGLRVRISIPLCTTAEANGTASRIESPSLSST
jgi:signal transduction histidine kinase